MRFYKHSAPTELRRKQCAPVALL